MIYDILVRKYKNVTITLQKEKENPLKIKIFKPGIKWLYMCLSMGTPKFVRLTVFHACAERTFTNDTETYQSYLLDTVWTIDNKNELLYDAYLR